MSVRGALPSSRQPCQRGGHGRDLCGGVGAPDPPHRRRGRRRAGPGGGGRARPRAEAPGCALHPIESAESETAGIGQATISPIRACLKVLGGKLNTFVRHTQATYKLALRFLELRGAPAARAVVRPGVRRTARERRLGVPNLSPERIDGVGPEPGQDAVGDPSRTAHRVLDPLARPSPGFRRPWGRCARVRRLWRAVTDASRSRIARLQRHKKLW